MRRQNPESTPNARRAQTPHMRHIIAAFCRTALDDYKRSGCPFGNDVDGMLIWFEYGQRTTLN